MHRGAAGGAVSAITMLAITPLSSLMLIDELMSTGTPWLSMKAKTSATLDSAAKGIGAFASI
jgi:hypothetical protein